MTVWYAGCTLHTRQSSTQGDKYQINILRKIVYQVGSIYKIIQECTVKKKMPCSTAGNCVTINIQIYHNMKHKNLPIMSCFGHYAITSYVTPWKCWGCSDSTVLPSRNACLLRSTCHCSNKFRAWLASSLFPDPFSRESCSCYYWLSYNSQLPLCWPSSLVPHVSQTAQEK